MDDGMIIEYSGSVTALRLRLAAAMRAALTHAPHGCDAFIAAQGAAFAYAELLHALGAGPDPVTASIGDVMIAHGIPGPWDYLRPEGSAPTTEDAPVTAPIVGADAVEIIATFTGDLDAVEGIGPDGMPVYPWPDGSDVPPSF